MPVPHFMVPACESWYIMGVRTSPVGSNQGSIVSDTDTVAGEREDFKEVTMNTKCCETMPEALFYSGKKITNYTV